MFFCHLFQGELVKGKGIMSLFFFFMYLFTLQDEQYLKQWHSSRNFPEEFLNYNNSSICIWTTVQACMN